MGPTPAEHLSHFVRMSSSHPLARDSVWMLLEYSLEAGSIGLLSKRFGGKRRKDLGERLQKLGLAISTARVLYRALDTLTMIDWLNGLYSTAPTEDETSANDNKSLLTLEKIQAWSMLLCAPLEVTFYLCMIGALKIRQTRANFIGMWSARFWSLFVLFQMLHSLRARQLLEKEETTFLDQTVPLIASLSTPTSEAPAPISSASSDSGVGLIEEVASGDEKDVVSEKAVSGDAPALHEFEEKMAEFGARRKDLRDALRESLGIFPLTLHWSTGEALFPDGSAYVGVLGSISAMFGIRRAWRATA